MNINGKHYRTIWLNDDGWSVEIIDQTKLPFVFETVTLRSLDDAARAIKTMQVRGAPLIGATAAYGVALALRADASDEALDRACDQLAATRPTAINLRWALEEMKKAVRNQPHDKLVAVAYARAWNWDALPLPPPASRIRASSERLGITSPRADARRWRPCSEVRHASVVS